MPKKFDFISPGVQLNEIDQSILPAQVRDAGPVLIGRARSGPSMQPVKVNNYSDFVAIFGEPVSGEGASDADVWRDGNVVGPTYAAYAAQAHLASETTPLTFVRLLGEQNSEASVPDGYAGWSVQSSAANNGATSATPASNYSAFGLFVFPSASSACTGTLGAIIYTNGACVTLSGTIAGSAATTSSAGQMISSAGNVASQFKIEVQTAAGTAVASKQCHFTNGSQNYIRDQLNTNPQKLKASGNFGTTNVKYFLGETFEQAIIDQTSGSTAAKQYGMILPLMSGSLNYADHRMNKEPSKTGWFINRKPGEQELFRLVSLHDGEWFQDNFEIFVEDLKLGDSVTPSSFSLVLKQGKNTVENFKNLNLDPSSDSYIAKRIGDQNFNWNSLDLKYDVRGLYVNKSDYFRVEVAAAVANKELDDSLALPMGFLGPLRPKRFHMIEGSSGPQAWNETENVGITAVLSLTCDARSSTGEAITLVLGGVTHTINFTSDNLADSSTSFTTAAGDIGVGDSPSLFPLADKILALITSHSNYTAPATGDGTMVITGPTPGPHWTIGSLGGNAAGDFTEVASTPGTDTDDVTYIAVKGGADLAIAGGGADAALFAALPSDFTASVVFPTTRLTVASSNRGGHYKARDHFGIRHHIGSAARRDASYTDLIRAFPANNNAAPDIHASSIPSSHERAFVFHLEDIVYNSSNTMEHYLISGSYAAENTYNHSYTGGGDDVGVKYLCGVNKIKQYRAGFWGGFDGIDIKEVEPFSNANLSDKAAPTSYAYNTLIKALDTIADPEVVEMDMISIPGLTNPTLTNKVLDLAESRGDSLAIIDLANGYAPKWEGAGTVSYGSITDTLTALEGRQLNTSYGATYYPWVVISDSNQDVVPVPSSVAAIGALAKSAADAEVWFAPAGFNRGGIKNLGSNNSGLVVTHTIEHLTKDNRDDLYALNVNPIARFPATNQIVIFGQKTLQQTSSALDRINVRRLLLFLKRRIGKIADTILFEPNVQTTWNNFKSSADAVLADVQSKLGITEYKLVLDESTTTADLIDRNVMYAKIFIKPARAIEFIVVDFVVTRSGVEF
jgi:hypothetical protein